NGGVGLYEVVVGAEAERPALGADYSRGDRMPEPERVTDREHPVAYFQAVGVAEPDRGELFLGLYLEEGEVRFRVGPYDLRAVYIAVLEYHLYVGRLFDDVVVRDDVSVLAEYESRSEPPPPEFSF